MNGEEDAFYSQDVQIIQYDAAAGHFTDIGEPYSFETRPRGVTQPAISTDGGFRDHRRHRRRPARRGRGRSASPSVVVRRRWRPPWRRRVVDVRRGGRLESAGVRRVGGRRDSVSGGASPGDRSLPVISTSNCQRCRPRRWPCTCSACPRRSTPAPRTPRRSTAAARASSENSLLSMYFSASSWKSAASGEQATSRRAAAAAAAAVSRRIGSTSGGGSGGRHVTSEANRRTRRGCGTRPAGRQCCGRRRP